MLLKPLTIATNIQVDDAPHANVDNSQESLVLLLELLLIEDLHSQYTVFRGPPDDRSAFRHLGRIFFSYISKLSFQYGLRVFLITPVVLVCSPLIVATAKGSGNPDESISVLDTTQVAR